MPPANAAALSEIQAWLLAEREASVGGSTIS
jgi:hypothetical protein